MSKRGTLFAAALVALSFGFEPASATEEAGTTLRSDGSVIHWSLDRPASPERYGLIVLAQGSGCLSVLHNENLASIRSVFPDLAALMLEKPGVQPGDAPDDDHMDCSDEFRQSSTVSQRVADHAEVLAGLADASWWNGDIVLFGGSEGGLVAAVLAARVEADAAILMSTGGGVPFGEAILESVPDEGQSQIAAQFDTIRSRPDSTDVWAGSSLRFWADIIDRRVADDMLEADTAFLLIQGGADQSGPASVARATADLFAERGRCNLTYWEFPGYDHGLSDGTGASHMMEVMEQAASWLRHSLSQERNAACGPAR